MDQNVEDDTAQHRLGRWSRELFVFHRTTSKEIRSPQQVPCPPLSEIIKWTLLLWGSQLLEGRKSEELIRAIDAPLPAVPTPVKLVRATTLSPS